MTALWISDVPPQRQPRPGQAKERFIEACVNDACRTWDAWRAHQPPAPDLVRPGRAGVRAETARVQRARQRALFSPMEITG